VSFGASGWSGRYGDGDCSEDVAGDEIMFD
jgi:hypothetical protein